ncbi:class I SAM-dependent methyltransferase [Fulvimarina endophytica]|uniref:Class I SAM-dependent methyltransferase n=1 Tax=Fulvimarina endophytica TaxID=2293836 RepID=A0A371X5N8_9HYPH|nr:cyclopropane-fatty-acyl-phospholipid synthase family protein [Fulvimarina endophytica]RFC64523.1 class I SAM-dependent methyltransferase [Fulvimarina endophytica]
MAPAVSPALNDDEARLKDVVSHVVDVFKPGFGVVLWDGQRLGQAEGPALVLADPAGLARLVMRPSLGRAIALWMDKGIDLSGGTFFDLSRLRSDVRTKDARRQIRKAMLAKALPALWRLSRKAGAEEAVGGEDGRRSGSSKEAIQYHYDVGNDFYRLFLDERMLYSCAYFDGWHEDIDKAQEDKLDMICRKLRLKAGERFLDIGCGWGALLIHAASRYGVSGHGVTLSQEQFDLATARVREAGLQDRITIELKPFQALTGSFDKIASIGMYEHVGFKNHEAYFGAVSKLLRKGGLYLHHAITRPAKKSERAFHRGTPEYRAIIRYIFPGAELDHIGHSTRMLEKHRFEVHDIEDWREHYALTCKLWHDRLLARFDEASALAGERKARLWLLYLAGCSLGFTRGGILIYQTLASRRGKGASEVPPTRRDLYAH